MVTGTLLVGWLRALVEGREPMVAMLVPMGVGEACDACGRDVLTCPECGFSLSEHFADPHGTLWCPYFANPCDSPLDEWRGSETREKDGDEVTLCEPCASDFDDETAYWADAFNVAYERARARGWED
ncbi:MAG: hypothetical protein IMZ67_07235 [Acidobacteria bacterium]|nr:hypothetical protein [Acidobacteriota bacterium]